MGQRLALLIGNTDYEDTTLSRLKAPQADVVRLAEVLQREEAGAFDEVVTLLNEPSHLVRRRIARFFSEKMPDDLLLFYFSGHGVKDDQGFLYLAVNDTESSLLNATAIPASSITYEMDNSRSRRQVIILDCCHSGAFAQGSKGVTGASVGTAVAFQGTGYGRVVLTATDSTQYAWQGEEVIGEEASSVFTHYLIEGLDTGEADTDSDGEITLDELYDYVYRRVVQNTPKQTPGKWSYKEQGEIVIARNPNPTKPAELPPELMHTIDSAFVQVREGAINELGRLLRGSHAGIVLGAKQALERMAEHDDSIQLRNLARAKLRGYSEGTLPKAVRDVDLSQASHESPIDSVIQEEGLDLIETFYRNGKRSLEQGNWEPAYIAFQQVLALNSGYRDAAHLYEIARKSRAASTSGTGDNAIVPEEIRKWNWGAFLLSGFWGLGNRTYIALICFIPYVALVMAFVLGAKGNEWAWRNKRWESVEHFQRVQQKWTRWGVGFIITIFAIYIISVALVVAFGEPS